MVPPTFILRVMLCREKLQMNTLLVLKGSSLILKTSCCLLFLSCLLLLNLKNINSISTYNGPVSMETLTCALIFKSFWILGLQACTKLPR